MKYYIFILLTFNVGIVSADQTSGITYKEYVNSVEEAQNKIDYSDSLIKHSDIHTLVPEKKHTLSTQSERTNNNKPSLNNRKGNPAPSRPVSSKVKNTASISSKQVNSNSAAETIKIGRAGEKKSVTKGGSNGANIENSKKSKKTTKKKSYYYFSPSISTDNSSTENTPLITQPDNKQIKFGITIGQRVKVKLLNGASNVQNGLLKFELMESFKGFKRTIPRHSLFFGKQASVIGTARLFANTNKGIIKGTNEEFTFKGVVYGIDGEPGLIGLVVNDGKALVRAENAGSTAIGIGIVDAIPGGDIAADASKAVTSELLKEKQRNDEAKNGRSAYVVEASPQEAYIEIEETF